MWRGASLSRESLSVALSVAERASSSPESDRSLAHGSFARFFNSANVRPAKRPSLVAVESNSSAWSLRPASNAVNHRRKRAS